MILDCNDVDLLYNESLCSFVVSLSAVNRESKKDMANKLQNALPLEQHSRLPAN